MEGYKKEILNRLISNNYGDFNQQTQLNKILSAILFSWENWDKKIIITYKNFDDFIANWIDNEDFEANNFDVKHLKKIFNLF